MLVKGAAAGSYANITIDRLDIQKAKSHIREGETLMSNSAASRIRVDVLNI